jgi:hypothetical protein
VSELVENPKIQYCLNLIEDSQCKEYNIKSNPYIKPYNDLLLSMFESSLVPDNVRNVERSINYGIRNNNVNRTYNGEFEFNASMPIGSRITYVESDSRIVCAWVYHVVSCKNRSILNLDSKENLSFKVKFWPSDMIINEVIKAKLTTSLEDIDMKNNEI